MTPYRHKISQARLCTETLKLFTVIIVLITAMSLYSGTSRVPMDNGDSKVIKLRHDQTLLETVSTNIRLHVEKNVIDHQVVMVYNRKVLSYEIPRLFGDHI